MLLVIECHICQLNAQLVLSGILCLVFILHIWMHIAKEKLLSIIICKTESHSLVGWLAT